MGQTPAWGLPYPEQSTLITDSAAIVQELAEKIDTALSAVTASDEYTVPGTLIADMINSGTFTPPAGVTVVHVVIIGGGGDGSAGTGVNQCGAGGGGGGLRVFHGLPVSTDVDVIIGAQGTASSFGALTAPAGIKAIAEAGGYGLNSGGASAGGSPQEVSSYLEVRPGQDGPRVNGTAYTGGGGGGGTAAYAGSNYVKHYPGPGGAGGGGYGANSRQTGTGSSNMPPGAQWNGARGSSGTGGGGGGGGSNVGTGPNGQGGLGGSGRVMIWTEQTPLTTLNLPANADPLVVAALDDQGTMTGAYAVEVTTRELPALGVRVVDYPTEPVETGRTEIVLVDPENPTGPTAVVPILAWPTVGWKYTNNTWEEPKNE